MAGIGKDERLRDSVQYQAFLIEALTDSFEEFLVPDEIIDEIGLSDSQQELILELPRGQAARKLVEFVLNDPHKHVSLFVASLEHKGCERFTQVLYDQKEDEDLIIRAERHEKHLKMIQGSLRRKIIPSEIIDSLKTILHDGDYERILALEDQKGPLRASLELFRCMKRKTSKWSIKFVDVLCNIKPDLYRKFDPLHEDIIYSRGGEEESSPGSTPDGTCEDDFELSALSDEEKQDTEDLEKDLTSKLTRSQELNMRRYQIELCEHPTLGENTIVYAPTGSGKTRVAIYIAKFILENMPEGEMKKVLFLEPTVALVDQTYRAVNHFLGREYSVAKLRGRDDTSLSLHTILPVNDVVVMTPKILDNHLENGMIPSVSGLCRLMILDECHHTRKGEVYNQVMLKYIREKLQGICGLPQILGLTATLGVEKAHDVNEAMVNILKVCSNLDTSIIAKVERHQEELKAKVAVPDEETITLQDNPNSPSRKILENAMSQIERHLYQFRALLDDDVNTIINRSRGARNEQMYTNWAVDLKEASSRLDSKNDPARTELIQNLYTVADHLYNYNVALELEEKVRVKDVIDYLKENLKPSVRGRSTTVHELELFRICTDVLTSLEEQETLRKTDKSRENPRLKQLAGVLEDLLESEDEDFRVIIFARTIRVCMALAEWLNEDPHLPPLLQNIKTSHFTGQDGMTVADQDLIIEKFRQGKIRGIVSTSVGHEGLDIPECRYVLSYDYVGNEITSLQTKGRSRKSGGRSLVLATDKGIKKQEQNVYKAFLMKQAVDKIKDIDNTDIEKALRNFQEESVEIADVQELSRKLNAQKMKDVEFELICKKCRRVCTRGDTLRMIIKTHRVSIDPSFQDLMNIRYTSNPQVFDEVSIDGSISCKDCKNSWGTWIKYEGVNYPSLAVKNFSVKGGDVQEPQNFKQWKKCPYVVAPLTTRDTLRFLSGDDDISDNADSDDEFNLF